MDGIRALVVAFLITLAPIGGVVAADTAGGSAGLQQQTTEDSDRLMAVYTPDNTSGYLAPPPDDIDRIDDQRSSLDVAAAVEVDARGLEGAYLRETLERRYENADSDTERRVVVENGLERLAGRVDELRETERTAIRRYSDGEITTRELLRTLSVVTRGAGETEAALEWLETNAEEIGAESKAERAAAEQVRIVSMNGPVRTRLVSSHTGGRPSQIHVETVNEGIVIATVDRSTDTYLREAYDPSARTQDVGDSYDDNPSPALERFGELYPWTIEGFESISVLGPEQVRLYRFGATHSHGNLETYLDGGSTDVLYERQWIDSDGVPSSNVGRTDGDLRIIATTTRAGGPLGITAIDRTTDSEVDAEIELNGDPIGSTDGDRLWTVAPRGPTTINATYSGQTVTLETSFE